MTFIVTAGGIAGAPAAYGAKHQRKAQKRASEDQRFRELIDGSAPNIAQV